MKKIVLKFKSLSTKLKIVIVLVAFLLLIVLLPNIIVYAAAAFFAFKSIDNKIHKYIVTGILCLITFFSAVLLIPDSAVQLKESNSTVQPQVNIQTSNNLGTSNTSAATSSAPQSNYYKVTDVVDGDTIKVISNGKNETIRLIGVDTPETVDPRKDVQCFGIESSAKAKQLLLNSSVRLEMDPTQGERDKYGRLLAYVYLQDGRFYNQLMIEEGYAHEYTYNIPYKYQTEFKSAQKSAQAAKLGLWSSTTCGGTTSVTTSPQVQQQVTVQPTAKFYTSSYSTTKYYYPAACDGWKSLSAKYLKSFDSLEALLAAYPSRTLSKQCQ